GEVLYYPLNTSGAFHSRFMQDSKEKFLKYLKRFKLSAPKIPVISNVTARPYLNDEIEKNLSEQIASAVRWCDSIQYLIQIGDENSDPMSFEEVGHGDVLTKLAAKIQEETQSLSGQNGKAAISEEETENVVEAKNESTENSPANSADSTEIRTDIVEKIRALSDAEDKVKFWNETFSIGTKVKSTIMDYEDLETRTEAVVLFGHRAAVYMKDYNGYFDLDEITPM
ncbi:MAG: hypothetical protein OQJ89_15555, partial [Kangiellaceae bacterium]|nr:hypothetical protein [Kangiellaceae bacterium]